MKTKEERMERLIELAKTFTKQDIDQEKWDETIEKLGGRTAIKFLLGFDE